MLNSGMPHSRASRATRPRSASISRSEPLPTLTWMEMASAPSLMASSTVQTRVLALGEGDRAVEPDRWMIRPTSLPRRRWPLDTSPL